MGLPDTAVKPLLKWGILGSLLSVAAPSWAASNVVVPGAWQPTLPTPIYTQPNPNAAESTEKRITDQLKSTAFHLGEQVQPRGSFSRFGQWVDLKHARVQQGLNNTAQNIDDWFGRYTDEEARANLNILVDSTWNRYDGATTDVRVRGGIELPNASRRLRLVFGDESLDNDLSYTPGAVSSPNATVNRNPAAPSPRSNIANTTLAERTRQQNNSLALRWINNVFPGYRTDLDLGLRGTSDVYVRARARRNWDYAPDVRANFQQVVRYGTKSELYAQTDYGIGKALSRDGSYSNSLGYQATAIYDQRNNEYGPFWVQRAGQYFSFRPEQTLSYGLLAAGYFGNSDYLLNQYGPWVSYRQPFLRKWFYVRGDASYVNDKVNDHSHNVNTFVRLEAVF